jgi:hypothetical protein
LLAFVAAGWLGGNWLIRRGLRAPRVADDATPGGVAWQAVEIPTANRKILRGWWIPSGERAPALAVVHGWGGNAAMMLPLVGALHDAGYGLLLFSARNHGASDGDTFSSLPRFAEDLEHAFDWLRGRPEVDARHVSLLGHSVGAFGRGTQRLEAILGKRFPQARILRIDRDSAGSRKQWDSLVARIHGGDVDILVGTQMLAKGHDFPKLTLVGAIAPDAALFAADWRAPERLFAQLMQVAGRAGRHRFPGEVLIQTQFPDHPLYDALARHDYPAFAATQLVERRQAGFPPYAHQAMLRAEANAMADALAFLNSARACWLPESDRHITFYDPVPMRLSRRASLERAQLLIESPSRRALQHFLANRLNRLDEIRTPSHLRWHLEVDPLEF